MKKLKQILWIVPLVVMFMANVGLGQTTFGWNFGTVSPGNANANINVPVTNLTTPTITQGNNNGTTTLLTTTSASSTYTGASGSYNAGAAARTGALVTGASGSAYFEFTLTPGTGYTVSLSSVSFGTRSTSTGPQAYTLRSSVDSYASDITTGTIANTSTWALKSNTGLTFSSSSAVTFRIYGYNGTGSAAVGTANWRIDDLSLTVTVASAGLLTPPTLTAAVNPTVDSPFDVTFTDNSSWRGAITGITVGGTTLTAGYSVSAGKITFTPSASNPANLLQTPGTKSIIVIATGYSDAPVSQIINAGAANKLAIKTQPTAPTANGTMLVTQPAVYIQDQYGNLTTSTADVLANAIAGSGTWTVGGTTTKAGVSGTATFTDLTATSSSAVTGATINFTSTGLTAITSNGFDIPAPVPVLTVTPSTLSGFTYIFGNGPSSSQQYAVSGVYLDGTDVTISCTTNYEVSTDNDKFSGSVLLSYSSNTLPSTLIYVRLISGLSSGNYNNEIITNIGGGATQKDVTCSGIVTTPTITLSITTLTGFTYEFGSGPSTSQTYNVSGTNLTPSSGNITITAPTDYEVSTSSAGTYSSSFTIAYTGNALSATPIYVRLKAGLSAANYDGEILSNTGGGAAQQDVTCSGSVTAFIPPITWVGTAGDGLWSSATNWSGGVVPGATDKVLLDNSTVTGNYSVDIGVTSVTLYRLTITPTGNTITLTLTSSNTSNPGLTVGDGAAGTDDIIINNGGILKNSSGATTGNGIAFNTAANGILRINNGGRYIHNTLRANSGIVSQLSTVSGTETGIFEYNVPMTAAFSPSFSNRTFGTLILTNSTAFNYTSSGGNPLTVRGDFILNCSSTGGYISSMTGAMNIAGNIINNGTDLVITAQVVNLNGTTTQNISGTSNITLGALTINNSTGVTLSRNLTVNGALTLTNGLLTLGANDLTIGSSGSIIGGGAGSYIVTNGTGQLKRTVNNNDTYVFFPVGISAYNPANIKLDLTSTTNIFGVIVNDVIANSGYDPTKAVNRQWDITKATSDVSNATIQFQFNAGEGLTNYLTGSIAHWNSSSSSYDAISAIISGTGSGPYTITNIPFITTFSPFIVGNDGVNPVELSSFTSNIITRDVKLNWTTASENNNAGFEILRSAQNDYGSWTKIGYVTGNGTKTTPTNYSFEDKKLNTGKYKYRLKQIDFNGNFEYFNLAGEIEIGVPKKYDISQNYPNPFNPTAKIDFDLPYDSKVSMKLYDISGKEVMTLVNEQKSAGYYTVQMNGNNLSSGMYFYRIIAEGNGQNFVMTKKAMLIK